MNVALPQVVDPLGEALHFLRMSGIFYSRSELTAPWALALPPMKNFLMLHVITAGRCWLEVDSTPGRMLQQGDLALVPHGEGHQISSEQGMAGEKLFEIPREQVSERYEILRLGGGGAPATMICGVFQFDHPAAIQLITHLPKMIVVEAWDSPHTDWIQSTLRMMAAEAKELRPGGETIITRLADILVIHAIRSWIAQDGAAQTGWLGALQDDQIGRVISRIHREPERPWSLESLAAEAAMSRSAFAARFTELVGESAVHYVTRWRMHTALTWLKENDGAISEISRRVGYESEAAFNRAFKRYMGITPGAVRRDSDSRQQVGVSGGQSR
jgi:AraC-like DNA-binding protein